MKRDAGMTFVIIYLWSDMESRNHWGDQQSHGWILRNLTNCSDDSPKED